MNQIAPYPDHVCKGCALGRELIVSSISSIVGQAAIHAPEGWVCEKWIPPEAYNVMRKKHARDSQ